MADQEAIVLSPRLSKTCNLCKERKVRCVVPAGSTSCASCAKRNAQCHFSKTRRALRHPHQVTPDASIRPGVEADDPIDASKAYNGKTTTLPELFIDKILQDPSLAGAHPANDAQSIFKMHNHCKHPVARLSSNGGPSHPRRKAQQLTALPVTSSNLAYFSEAHIRFVSQRLGHEKLLELIKNITNVANAKFTRAKENHNASLGATGSCPAGIRISEAVSRLYVGAYFEHVHPLYPFLNRRSFEAKVLDVEVRDKSPAFRALYHCVLALGCQYAFADCSFRVGEGEAWGYFKVALSLLRDVLFPPEALVNLQAITAMAIFGCNTASMSIGEFLTMEAARMAQSLGYHRPMLNSKEDEATCYRTFWVIYILEKPARFMIGKSSSIVDHDIGCPIIPLDDEDPTIDFETFVSVLRLCRLLSRAYERLFSVSATLDSVEQYEINIDSMKSELEAWRDSLPARIKPGLPISGTKIAEGCLRLHFTYHALSIALGRLDLYISSNASRSDAHDARMREAKKQLMDSAKAVAHLTVSIDIRPYTPIWMLAASPLSAMFILFDMVVQDPFHPETETNLALLDSLAGYFSRFDYAAEGSIPCGLFSGFAHIANQFVREQSHRATVAVEDAEAQNINQGSHGINLASRLEYTAGDGESFSEGPASGNEAFSYSLLGDEAAIDAQLFAGYDFANFFEVNVAGFGRL